MTYTLRATYWVLLTIAFFAFGVPSLRASPIDSPIAVGGGKPLTICEIRKNSRKWLGKEVLVQATYETDSSNYSYFADETNQEKHSCKYMDVISVGYISQMKFPSVNKFFRKKESICAKLRKEGRYLCVINAVVLFRGILLSNENGFYINMKKIYQFKFEIP